MSIKLNRPLGPEENNKKNQTSAEKTILYSGFEPRTSGETVGSHNHSIIRSIRSSTLNHKINKGKVTSEYAANFINFITTI
jgi:hypothetical protein